MSPLHTIFSFKNCLFFYSTVTLSIVWNIFSKNLTITGKKIAEYMLFCIFVKKKVPSYFIQMAG